MKYEGKDLVIKYFEILKNLDIPTIEVIEYTGNTLLLEALDKVNNGELYKGTLNIL